MPFRLTALIALFCLAPLLHGQTEEPPPPRYQIYGGYGYLSNAINGVPGARHSTNGWNATFGFPAWHNLRFVVDASGYPGSNDGATVHSYFIMCGGQYHWRLGRRETVFGTALFGAGGVNRYWGPGGLPGETASFALFTGGGLDTRLARHLAFRVEGGYQYSYFKLINNLVDQLPYYYPGLPTNFGRASSGLVVGF